MIQTGCPVRPERSPAPEAHACPSTVVALERRHTHAPPHPTVLVVDDEAGFRHVLSLLLGRMGFSVLEAHDGDEAIARYLGEDVDIVLTDIFMPGMDGVELIRSLRTIEPKVRIVAFSAAVDTSPGGAICGEVPLLTKPMEITQLVTALRRTLEP